ncbi:riboflavin kinase [Candidatus Uhrbacteria bacterium]|nr:riboflavin kinase [Candidatus Uhrbacteria bacterium]
MKLRGKVVSGLKQGKKLGYPTANLDCADTPLPMPGVYAAKVRVEDNYRQAIAVVGARVEQGKPLTEVLILDFQGELYGLMLEVEILDKISEIEKFDHDEDLKNKIEKDIDKAREYFSRH